MLCVCMLCDVDLGDHSPEYNLFTCIYIYRSWMTSPCNTGKSWVMSQTSSRPILMKSLFLREGELLIMSACAILHYLQVYIVYGFIEVIET